MTDDEIKLRYSGPIKRVYSRKIESEWELHLTAVQADREEGYSFTCDITSQTSEEPIRSVTVNVPDPEAWPVERVRAALLDALDSGAIADGTEITMKDTGIILKGSAPQP